MCKTKHRNQNKMTANLIKSDYKSPIFHFILFCIDISFHLFRCLLLLLSPNFLYSSIWMFCWNAPKKLPCFTVKRFSWNCLCLHWQEMSTQMQIMLKFLVAMNFLEICLNLTNQKHKKFQQYLYVCINHWKINCFPESQRLFLQEMTCSINQKLMAIHPYFLPRIHQFISS